MGTTQGRGKIVFWVVGISVCLAWLAFIWSPHVEEPPTPIETSPHVEPKPEPKPEPEPASKPPQPKAAPKAQAPASDAGPPPQPERIPTPHPMSLDQSKPPEQFGPLAELKKDYDSESRSAESSETEAGLRALINTPNIPSELVQDISCRRSLCKIEAHWTPRRRIGFSVLLESFKHLYSERVAVEPAAAQSTDGSYVTTLYIRLK